LVFFVFRVSTTHADTEVKPARERAGQTHAAPLLRSKFFRPDRCRCPGEMHQAGSRR
jgi:hypothetical protein